MRPHSAYPGALFKLPLVLAGLRSSTVPGIIHAQVLRYWGSNAHLGLLQEAQEVGSGCKNVTYSFQFIPKRWWYCSLNVQTINAEVGKVGYWKYHYFHVPWIPAIQQNWWMYMFLNTSRIWSHIL